MSLVDIEKLRKRISTGRFFKDVPIEIKSHSEGWVDTAEINKSSPPPGTVQECLNTDFNPEGDKRRDPYSVAYDLSSVLPTGYVINNFFEKIFIDADGINKTCIIAVALKAGSKAKIYINKYYNPSSDYGNNHYGYLGWAEGGWVELTELFTDTIDTVTGGYPGEGSYQFEMDGAGLSTTAGYYKGWFVYKLDDGINVCIGQITWYNNSGGTGIFEIFVNPDKRPVVGDTVKLVRFPVTVLNEEQWDDITDSDFEETFNSVRIALGHESQPVLINFLSEKKFFGLDSETPPPSFGNYKPNWNGFWMSFDAPILDMDMKKDLHYYTAEFNWEPDYFESQLNALGIRLRVEKSKTDGTSSFFYEEYWSVLIRLDGFQSIFLTSVLGARFQQDTEDRRTALTLYIEYKVEFERRMSHTELFYMRATDAEGYNGVFNYYYEDATGKQQGTAPDPKRLSEARCGLKSINEFANIGLSKPEYDPTGAPALNDLSTRGVYEGSTAPPVYYEIELTATGGADSYKWRKNGGSWSGNIGIQNQPQDINHGSTAEKLTIYFLNTTGHTSGDKWTIRTTPAYTRKLQQYAIDTGEEGDKFELNPEMVGERLSVHLNQIFYKDVHVKPKEFIKVGETIIGLNIDPQNISEDTKTEKKQGVSKAAFSQVQQGNVNCYSIFSSERIQSLASEEITGSAPTAGKDFLVFTKKDCLWYSIVNEADLLLATKGMFINHGAYSRRGIVTAAFQDRAPLGTVSEEFGKLQFGGVYWISQGGIFMFLNNEPVNLLEGRWLKKYMTISDSDKQAGTAGYYANRKEIFFKIGSYIYVFSLRYKHWKIYSYGTSPLGASIARTGEMLFHGTNKIYKTEPEGTTQYLDEGANSYSSYFAQYLSPGSGMKNYIVDRVDLLYEMQTAINLGEETPGKIKIEAFSNDSSTADLHNGTPGYADRLWLLNRTLGQIAQRIGFRNIWTGSAWQKARKRVKYFKLKISTESGTVANWKKLLIRGIVVNLKVPIGQGGKLAKM